MNLFTFLLVFSWLVFCRVTAQSDSSDSPNSPDPEPQAVSTYTPSGPRIKIQFTSQNQTGLFYMVSYPATEDVPFWSYTTDVANASIFTLDGPTQFLFMNTSDTEDYSSGWIILDTYRYSGDENPNTSSPVSSDDEADVVPFNPSADVVRYGLQCSIATASAMSSPMTCSAANGGYDTLFFGTLGDQDDDVCARHIELRAGHFRQPGFGIQLHADRKRIMPGHFRQVRGMDYRVGEPHCYRSGSKHNKWGKRLTKWVRVLETMAFLQTKILQKFGRERRNTAGTAELSPG
ncbi:hypothetical protein N0V82_007367 [Gnomoniopsis sp. IMI 355080]|nr:hypothetical protein N0V82_007367 [Gnomoniopsis sp. IMI 355080]